MHELGAAAGIVGSGVYRHFESKLAILAELTDGVLDGLVDGARRIRAEHRSPDDALAALVDFHLVFALDQSDLIAVYLGEERNLSEADRRKGRRKQRTYLGEWTEVLAELRPDLAARRGPPRRRGRRVPHPDRGLAATPPPPRHRRGPAPPAGPHRVADAEQRGQLMRGSG